jgi:hypothetical protein
MTRSVCAAVSLGFILAATPLRGADHPHAGADPRSKVIWTNEDLEKLHAPGLISIVGQEDGEKPAPSTAPAPYLRTQDPNWYAARAADIHDELEFRQAQLREYRQALDDARSLEQSTEGVDLVDEDFAMTPETGMDILEQRVNETQSRLDALGDLARRNDIPPGMLRGHEGSAFKGR